MEGHETEISGDRKVRYIGEYAGESPIIHRVVQPNEVITVSSEIAELLVSSGQFEYIEPEDIGGETDWESG